MNIEWTNYERNVHVRDWGKIEYGEETNDPENVRRNEMEMEETVGEEFAGRGARRVCGRAKVWTCRGKHCGGENVTSERNWIKFAGKVLMKVQNSNEMVRSV